MELATSTTAGLQLLGNTSLIADPSFNQLLTLCFNNLNNPSSQLPIPGDKTTELGFLKQAYGALAIVVVEAAKHDLDSTVLSSVLEECRMETRRATTIIDQFMKHKSNIRNQLARYGNSFPHIVDVDWRLNYCIKSNLLDKIDEPVYHVSLTTEESGKKEPGNINFACTLEQMQDLVSKLKEATKCVEKASHI